MIIFTTQIIVLPSYITDGHKRTLLVEKRHLSNHANKVSGVQICTCMPDTLAPGERARVCLPSKTNVREAHKENYFLSFEHSELERKLAFIGCMCSVLFMQRTCRMS